MTSPATAGLPGAAEMVNPFRDHVVQDAWQSPADVAEIHENAFRACLECVSSASRGEPDSLLVYGPAGSGKTHLLTRLQRHLAETGARAPDNTLRCVFVYVRLQTTPQLLWQHVRRRLAQDLMRRQRGLSELQRLLAHQHASQGQKSLRGAIMGMRVLRDGDQEALSEVLLDVASRLHFPRDLSVVLDYLAREEWVRDASAWLSGDPLPEAILDKMGLSGAERDEREQAARDVVMALARLSMPTLPIVFCFDQVEAMLRSPSDADAFYSFGRLAADLCDASRSVAVLTCLQSAQIETLQGAVFAADRERFAKRNVALNPLRLSEAKNLVLARLRASEALAPLRAAHPENDSFPFSEGFMKGLADVKPLVARRVLAECARQLDQVMSGRSGPPRALPPFLTEQLDKRARQAPSARSDLRSTVVRGAAVLSARGDVSIVDGGDRPEEVDIVLEQKATAKRVALSVREETDGRALTRRLEALVKQGPRKDRARLVIVRGPDVSISTKAVKAKAHLDALVARGALWFEPSKEALAALDALSSLLADAQSGDLANEGETVTESSVVAWIRALGANDPARSAALDGLVEAWFADGSPAEDKSPPLAEPLRELVGRNHVVAVEDASRALGAPPDAICATARRSPERFLLLHGPPALILDVAGVAAESEDGS